MSNLPTTAGDVYEVHLERHERQGLRRIGLAVWAALSAATMGFLGTPSVGEFVIRRRDDRREVLRMDAESEESTTVLLTRLEEQLGTLSPEEFDATWSIA